MRIGIVCPKCNAFLTEKSDKGNLEIFICAECKVGWEESSFPHSRWAAIDLSEIAQESGGK